MTEMAYIFYSSIYFGLTLYWLPLWICLIGYSHRTFVNYKKDLDERERKPSYTNQSVPMYNPTDTIGSVLGRFIVCVCPVVNLWCAIFDVAPKLLNNFFKHLKIIFNTPLVPRSSKPDDYSFNSNKE